MNVYDFQVPQMLILLENSLFLVLEVVFENCHAIKPCIFFPSYHIFSAPSQLLMTFDQDTQQQKGTVVVRLAEPGKGKVHLYPSVA